MRVDPDRRRPKFAARNVLAALLIVCGCASRGRSDETELVVFAASSLTEAFAELAQDYERAHPDVNVRLVFAGSQILRLQIEQGASADVFASADPSHMGALEDQGLVAGSRTFAENELVVIVPPDADPIERFSDLGQASRIVIGTERAPIGIYARQVFENAAEQLGQERVDRIRDRVVSEESNARLVRAKVELGEADAALVYRTDATHSEGVRIVPIPEPMNVRARYPIGALEDAPQPRVAADFVEYITSDAGREVLARHGFQEPQ